MTIDDVYGSGDFYYGGLFFIFVYLTQRCLLNMSANMVFFFFFFFWFLSLGLDWRTTGVFGRDFITNLAKGGLGAWGGGWFYEKRCYDFDAALYYLIFLFFF